MIGQMIKNIRTSKKMSLKSIADITGIDIGHLSHIEKGERNPSYKALSAICSALEVSVTQFVGSIGKPLNEEQEEYGYIKYVPYNKAPFSLPSIIVPFITFLLPFTSIPQASNLFSNPWLSLTTST